MNKYFFEVELTNDYEQTSQKYKMHLEAKDWADVERQLDHMFTGQYLSINKISEYTNEDQNRNCQWVLYNDDKIIDFYGDKVEADYHNWQSSSLYTVVAEEEELVEN